MTSKNRVANWSGRPARLLAPAPCRFGRAGLPDPAPRITGSLLVCSPRFAIRRSSGDTVTARAQCLAVFPSDDSVIRRSPSLHWLPRATVRQLHRYYQSAPTSRRPSRPTPFRSPGGTTHCCSSQGSGELLLPAPPRNCAGASILCLQLTLVETCGISQVSRQPLCEYALLFDPADQVRQGH
jgi:hypothetical protein